MQYKGVVVICLLLIVLYGPVRAQDGVRYGMGMDLVNVYNSINQSKDNIYYYPLTQEGTVLYGVLTFWSIRVEPEIGIGWRHVSIYRPNLTDVDMDHSIIRLGIGIFPFRKTRHKTDFYMGIRVGAVMYRFKQTLHWDDMDTGVTRSRTDMLMSPSLGGEYRVPGGLSVGCEFQLRCTIPGNEKPDPDNFEAGLRGEDDDPSIETNVLLFLRWYFN